MQNPDADEEAVSWSRWQVSPGVEVTRSGDANWGKAQIDSGTPAYGHVVDTGDTVNKTFTVLCPKYGTNTGNVTVSIRGSASVFAQHDGTPSWSAYSSPISQAWRYVQLKLEYAP